MKKKHKVLSAKPVILLSASALLLLGSTVGSTRAALTYYSENYQAQVQVSNIGVSLVENGEVVADDNGTAGKLLENFKGEEKVVPGKAYDEVLTVTNSGSIDTYVRVILTKSWTDSNGNKDTTLTPDLIDLNLPGNGWVVDEDASTDERTILYYTGIVPAGASTPNLSDTLKIDNTVAEKVEEKVSTDASGNKIIEHVYEYDGYQFYLDAEVNAVQTHNAQDAIKSAWGVDVSVAADGTLSLQ